MQAKLLACLAAAAMTLTTAPAQGGTIQDASWAGSSNFDRIRYDNFHRGLGNEYKSVGIVQHRSGNFFTDMGTGTLIGRKWILTAAHVVTDADELSFFIDGKTYTANRWFVHSGYDGTTIGNGRDIALIKLDKPIKHINPSKIAPRTKQKSLTKEIITTVGYGGSGTGITGYDIPGAYNIFNWPIDVRTKRAGRNMIDVYYGKRDDGLVQGLGTRIFTTDFDPDPAWRNTEEITAFWIEHEDELLKGPGFEDIPVTLEWSTAFGDSGGPSFNDKNEIVGVTSWGTVVWYEIANDVWVPAGSFYHALNLINERDGAKAAPSNQAPDVEVFYSELGFTNVALHSNWIKKVIRLVNQGGQGEKLLRLALIGNSAGRGAVGFGAQERYGVLDGRAISNFSMRDRLPYTIPEPTTALLLLGGGTLWLARRRRA